MDAVDGEANAITLCIMQKCPLRNGVQKMLISLAVRDWLGIIGKRTSIYVFLVCFLHFLSSFIYFFYGLYLSSSREASPPTISTPGRAITLLQDLKAGRFRLKLALDSAYLPLSAEDTPTPKSVAEASSAPLDLKVSLYWEKCDFHTEQGLKGLERRCPSQP